jgi:hypothetical protein
MGPRRYHCSIKERETYNEYSDRTLLNMLFFETPNYSLEDTVHSSFKRLKKTDMKLREGNNKEKMVTVAILTWSEMRDPE